MSSVPNHAPACRVILAILALLAASPVFALLLVLAAPGLILMPLAIPALVLSLVRTAWTQPQ